MRVEMMMQVAAGSVRRERARETMYVEGELDGVRVAAAGLVRCKRKRQCIQRANLTE